MRLRRLCPICGAKMEVVIDKEIKGLYRLCCTECPLDYGRFWYHSKRKLIEAWENSPKFKKTNGRTKPKAVVKIDRHGNILERYSSLSEAARKNPMSKTSIENRTRHRLKNEFSIWDFSFRIEEMHTKEGN